MEDRRVQGQALELEAAEGKVAGDAVLARILSRDPKLHKRQELTRRDRQDWRNPVRLLQHHL